MNWKESAKAVLEAVGGETNVDNVVHCSTRLRINVGDVTKADTAKLEEIPGVMGVNVSGKQVQCIIGADVAKLYQEFAELEM